MDFFFIREKGILTYETFFVKERRDHKEWRKIPRTSFASANQSLQKLQRLFIRMEPRDQDDPPRTPPDSIDQMEKPTWIKEVERREYQGGFPKPGHMERALKFIRPLQRPHPKHQKDKIIKRIPNNGADPLIDFPECAWIIIQRK